MLRKAKIKDAQAIQKLICFYSEDGKMMFRPLKEIEQNITTFMVYEKLGEVVGICNLKYDWDNLMEIRSLGVDPRYHRQGIATQMVQDSIEQALLNQNCDTVFVLTYAVQLFEKLGFQIIDKMGLPQKVWNDCKQCLHQDNCDETAMSFSLIPMKKQTPLQESDQVLYS